MINSGEEDRNIMITNINLLSVNKLERKIYIPNKIFGTT